MKLKILASGREEKGSIDLPEQFSEKIRPDLIRRAVVASLANKRQPYGASNDAGKKSVSEVSKRRRKYRGSYGKGIARTPRKVLTRRGTQFYWVGAFAPNTVGGRRAHPPKAEKTWNLKVNKKERRKAIRSALAATLVKELVEEKGHIIPENYPFAVDSKLEDISKTKELFDVIKKLGFGDELERVSAKKVRAGKGKARGRKYKKIRGMLIVASENCPAFKAAKNIPGIEVVGARNLGAEMLAPGALPGRMTLFTEKAIKIIESEKLFTDSPAKKTEEKEEEPREKAVKKAKKETGKKPAKK